MPTTILSAPSAICRGGSSCFTLAPAICGGRATASIVTCAIDVYVAIDIDIYAALLAAATTYARLCATPMVSALSSAIACTIAVVWPVVVGTVAAIAGRRGRTVIPVAWIVVVVREVPRIGTPYQRTEEEVKGVEQAPLGRVKHASQTGVAVFPQIAGHVGLYAAFQKIVQIDLIHTIVLFIGEVELVGHFVSEVIGLLSGIFINNGFRADCHREDGEEGE